MPNNIWGMLKKSGIIIAIIAGVITSIIGVVSICNYIATPKSNLVASVEFTSFRLPLGIDEIIQRVRTQDFQKTTNTDDFDKSDIGKYPYLKSVWSAWIINNGTLTCKDIKIRLPSASVAVINDKKADVQSNGVIDIGELGAKDAIHVIAWANTYLSEYDPERVLLTYRDGVGKVMIRLTVSPFWSLLSRRWSLYLSFAFILFPIIGLLRSIMILKKHK